MKKSYLIIGLLILIIGSILFIGGIKMVEVADEAISEYETLPGKVVRILSPEQERHYQDAKEAKQTGQSLEIIGGVISVIGIIVMIKGLIVKEETVQSQETPQTIIIQEETPQENRYCKSCGRAIPKDSIVCPYCGVER